MTSAAVGKKCKIKVCNLGSLSNKVKISDSQPLWSVTTKQAQVSHRVRKS